MEQSSQLPDRGELIQDTFPLEKIEVPMVPYCQHLVCPKCRKGKQVALSGPGNLFSVDSGIYLIHECTNPDCKHRVSILDVKYPQVIFKEA